MLFNSYFYIFCFLPLTVSVYFLLCRVLPKWPTSFLVAASFFFYAYWEPIYLLLILASIYLNYFIGMYIAKRSSKSILVLGLVLNTIPLVYFKYSYFLVENFSNLSHLKIDWAAPVLPLAISFFTFQQIAYLVDSYKGITSEYRIGAYQLFVVFFPQLIAGPIVHHKEIIPQFLDKKNQKIRLKNFENGLYIFSIGIFKKVVIADYLSTFVKAGFDSSTHLNFFEGWVTSLSYTFQLYFDFSGYSDMAIGSALLFNIRIPDNFFSPYRSKNIQEFWRRWHITLGKWLKDYIYIPLGGNQVGMAKANRNILLTFLIGGIWHGAGWNFLFWGFLHGFGLVVLSFYKNLVGKPFPRFVGIFLTFLYVHFAWVFFRAKDIFSAKKIIVSLVDLRNLVLPAWFRRMGLFGDFESGSQWLNQVALPVEQLNLLLVLVFCFGIVFFCPNSLELTFRREKNHGTAFFAAILFVWAILSLSNESEFLYFQF